MLLLMKLSTTTSKLILVAVGLASGLAISELALRIIERTNAFSPSVKAYLRSYDPLFRRTGGGHWEAIPGARREHIRINSAGFRGEEHSSTSSQTLRLAILGDSEAFGEKLPEESLLSSVTQKTLGSLLNRPVEVLNYGIPGYNIHQEYKVLQKNVLPTKPHAVVLYYVLNDASLKQSAWLIPPTKSYRFLHTARLLSYIRNRPERQVDWESNAKEIQKHHTENFARVTQILRSMAQKLEEQHILFYLLICPELSGFESFDQNPFGPLYDDIKKLEAKNLKVIDPLPAFERSGRPPRSFWVDSEDEHKSAEATLLVSQVLTERLSLDRSLVGTLPQSKN